MNKTDKAPVLISTQASNLGPKEASKGNRLSLTFEGKLKLEIVQLASSGLGPVAL